jgi:CO/xanthine dehydrogenase Mo-binding subunit/aerobic-type carbon monoxide dehydrogenase small subunit (CoxS/CutS family)
MIFMARQTVGFGKCVVAVLIVLLAVVAGASAATKPNVIFILADDLGYGDLGSFGQTKIKTPNLDRLAAEGMRFTQAYAGTTVCAPSRCALLTENDDNISIGVRTPHPPPSPFGRGSPGARMATPPTDIATGSQTAAEYSITLNGETRTFTANASWSLLSALRYALKDTSPKNCCDVGICGTCTVLMDGKATKSCTTTLDKAAGKTIVTAAGIGSPEKPAPIQQAFMRCTGSQCGICTSGMIVACQEYLDSGKDPNDRDGIRKHLRTNLCRCTGYDQIVDSVQVAALIRDGKEEEAKKLTDDLFWKCTTITGDEAKQNVKRVIGHFQQQYKVIDKVTGRAQYCDDYPFDEETMPGLLHLAGVRSPYAHANIKKIDVSKALAIPGVVRVITGDDLPADGDNKVGMLVRDQPVIVKQSDKVRAVGDLIALVAADTMDIARLAVAAVEVEYEVLPGVFTAQEALAPGAPVIHPERLLDPEDPNYPQDPSQPNLVHHQHIHKGGDINSEADLDNFLAWAAEPAQQQAGWTVHHGEYAANWQDHAGMEPEVAMAWHDAETERVVVRAPVQHVFFARRNVREALAIHPKKIQILGSLCGGAYGKREDPYAYPGACLAAMVLKRPVKWLWTREETMQYTQKRHKMDHRFDAAIDPNGKIQAFKARIYLDGGAYRSWGKEIASKSAVMCTGPYEIPRVWVDTYRAYTNNPLCGAIRGFGTANTLAGTERFWHDVAEKAGIDQLAFRRSNSFVRGSYTSTMHHLPKGVVSVECIDAANKVFEWTKELPPNEGPWRHGKGIATMWYGNGFGRGVPDEGHPIIEVNTDGSVLIRASTVDYGQGSNTVFQMVESEVTGIPIDKINLLTADTVNTQNCGSTVAVM